MEKKMKTMKTPENELLSGKEIAELLGIALATPKKWSDRGLMPPYFTIGRNIRWLRTDITAWLSNRCPNQDNKPPPP